MTSADLPAALLTYLPDHLLADLPADLLADFPADLLADLPADHSTLFIFSKILIITYKQN